MILYKIFYIIKVIKFKLNLNYVYYLNLNYLSYQIAFQIGILLWLPQGPSGIGVGDVPIPLLLTRKRSEERLRLSQSHMAGNR